MNYKKRQNNRTLAFVGVLIITISQVTLASENDVEKEPLNEISYKITDGYGTYSGRSSTKIAAQSIARTKCVMNKVISYENNHDGLTPDEDTVDLFFNACINR